MHIKKIYGYGAPDNKIQGGQDIDMK